MNTADKFISAALPLFADKGFYGTSMDRIAREVGLTKQALIHHFRTKEKLYGAVLQQISDQLLRTLKAADAGATASADEHLLTAIRAIYAHMAAHPDDTRLLLRELLDNQHRAKTAEVWYLRPFLDELRGRLSESGGWHSASPAQQATHVYQLIGAMHYFLVSTTTLAHMYDRETVAGMEHQFVDQLCLLALAPPPDCGRASTET